MIDYRIVQPGVDLPIDEYRDLYTRAFPEYDEAQVPSRVLLGIDGDRVLGFLSGHLHDRHTFYVQHIGFCVPQLEGRWELYLGGLQALHQYGYRYLLGAIDASNTRALVWGLESGFRIIGTRQATSGVLYVEVIRDGETADR